MKDLILITAFTPTPKYVKVLEKTILSVKKTGFDILLISHSHTPLRIQKLCQYYFYDHLNDVTEDLNYINFEYFNTNEIKIQSKYFTKNFYGFAIYRMFSIASKIAINFGYERLHHLEYDTQVVDLKIFDEHNNHLQTHDAVFYTSDGTKDGFLMACFKSFNVFSLPETFKNYNKDHMSNLILNFKCLPLENYTKHIFKNLDVKFLSDKTVKTKLTGEILRERKKHFTIFFNPFNNKIEFFIRNLWTENQEIMVITNKNLIQNIVVEPNYWYTRTLCNADNFKNIKVFQDNSMIYEFKVNNPQELEIFKQNSFISAYEKNN